MTPESCTRELSTPSAATKVSTVGSGVAAEAGVPFEQAEHANSSKTETQAAALFIIGYWWLPAFRPAKLTNNR
jgi:hypothetical protein